MDFLFLIVEKNMGCMLNKMVLMMILEDEKWLVKDLWNLFVFRGDFLDIGLYMYKV